MIDHSKTFVMHTHIFYCKEEKKTVHLLIKSKMNWQCQFWLMIFLYSNKNLALIRLFDSENSIDVQSYDCIYYINDTAANNETIPYCIRTNQSFVLNRLFQENSCENNGIQWSFIQLKQMNISQDDVLSWNSSIELADRYANYLLTEYNSPFLKPI